MICFKYRSLQSRGFFVCLGVGVLCWNNFKCDFLNCMPWYCRLLSRTKGSMLVSGYIRWACLVQSRQWHGTLLFFHWQILKQQIAGLQEEFKRTESYWRAACSTLRDQVELLTRQIMELWDELRDSGYQRQKAEKKNPKAITFMDTKSETLVLEDTLCLTLFEKFSSFSLELSCVNTVAPLLLNLKVGMSALQWATFKYTLCVALFHLAFLSRRCTALPGGTASLS